jgi:1,4-dihydroxy-2-naphthoate octaprenyltransferase
MQNKGSADGVPVPTPKVVAADSVQAEEVPTIPLGSLQTINTLQPEVSVHSASATQAVMVPVPLVVQPAEYRRSLVEWLKVWWDGIRPAYFALALLPVVVGTVLAWTQSISSQTPFGHFHPLRFSATIATVALLQVGANLVNDYYDYLRGIDTSNPLGPGGLIQQGLIRPTRLLYIGLTALGLGASLGAITAFSGGAPTYVIGFIGLLCAYFYSATSRSLSALALGELVCFAVFGPLVTLGAYLVQTGHLDRSVLLYSIPLGLLATAVIHLNDMRDAESDAQAGKHTLASLLGLRWSRILYLLFLAAAYTLIIVLAVPKNAPHLLLITLWTLPTLVVAISGVLRTDTPAGLHLAMRQTIALEVYFTLWLVVALIATAVWPVLPHLPAIVLPA